MAEVSAGLAASIPAVAPSLPTVRLEVRPARGRATVYEVGDGGFLVGSVPGCDLRLPGTNLPPVLCLISRHTSGASLRKLAPVQPILINGRSAGSTYLADGDHLALGMADIVVSITAYSPHAAPIAALASDQGLSERVRHVQTHEQELRQLAEQFQEHRQARESELEEKKQLLEETARQVRRIQQDLSKQQAELEVREQAVLAAQQELNAQREQSGTEDSKTAGVREELATIKKQLYQRYHDRRERLMKQQLAIRKAGQKLQERKRRLDEQAQTLDTHQQQWDQKQSELQADQEQLAREREMLEEQHRLVASRQQEIQRELAERVSDLQQREEKLAEERAGLEGSQKQHQSDLVRLDRIQATLEQRQKQLQMRALEVDRRYEQLQRDTREAETHAAELDQWHRKLTEQAEELAQQKKKQDEEASQASQRSAAVEGQQAMLATLRTRLERLREELRQQEEALADQRALHEAGQVDLKQRLEEVQTIREGIENDRQLCEQERKRFDERRGIMEQAVAQLRQAQDSLAAEEANLRERQKQLDATAAEQSEQMALLFTRGQQLEELHTKIGNEKHAFKDREAAIAKAEITVTALQEQLRRRAEELSERHKQLTELEQRLQQQTGEWQGKLRLAEKDQQLAAERLETMRQELGARAAELELRQQELQEREQALKAERDRVENTEQVLAAQKHAIESEKLAWEVEHQTSKESLERERAALESAHGDFHQLAGQLPELEAQASSALDRLTRAREQLREQLAEIHTFARQSREELELARKQVQVEFERLRQQELALHAARDEHRLAVAAFRQQLIEWQGQVSEMKRVLLQDESRLERRQAEVEQKEQQIESTSARLAQQAEQLQQQQRQVEVKRGEMDRHLTDMREWYRRKLRELAGVDERDREQAASAGESPTPPNPQEPGSAPASSEEGASADDRAILSLPGELDPGDRQLGDLLRSLELIDADTLTALLVEARRQRRSLRQLLLAGNYLTLYQMALIEAGNLDGLVLGPVRLIDRLQATAHEAVYRVFDPRRNAEALLRVLAEEEMEDAVHPDEFRQRFAAAAAVRHVHVAATLEILEIASRPAVLQEWLTGLPSSDWPAVGGAPGVWFRLVSQAAVALQTAHNAGLHHGHLHPGSFVFTREGTLKLLGLGEPRWLMQPAPADDSEPSPAGDLFALGPIAAGWAALAPRRGNKPKPLPGGLQSVLDRLQAENVETRFSTAAELLEALDAASADVPANAAAWERFLREVREQSANLALQRSA